MAKFAVIGAGNGGCSMAVHLTRSGHEVNLFNCEQESFEPIRKLRGVNYLGALGEGFAQFSYVGSDLARAMEDVDFVVVVVPRNTHGYYADLLEPHLREGLGVAIIPGSGTSLLYRSIWADKMERCRIEMMETCTLTYSTRLVAADTVNIFQVRQNIGAVCLTGYESRVWKTMNAIFCFRKYSSIVESILSSLNPILHPAGMIMNAAAIEMGIESLYYKEVSGPAVCRVMEAADQERIAVLKAFSLPAPNLVELFYDAKYTDEKGRDSGTIYGALQNSEPNSQIKCPTSLADRYLVEDVSYGLVPFSQLAKVAGVPTPTIDAMIQMANVISCTDYHETGLNLNRMGLEGMRLEEIRAIGGEQ